MTATLESVGNVRHQADEMLAEHIANNPGADTELLADLLTPDQRHMLTMAGFASPSEVTMEVGRARAVAELKAQAGTARKRKAAAKAASDAAAMLNAESSAIKSAIAEAEAKLTLLEREARDTAAKRDAMQAAVDHLRSDRFLPKHIAETAAFARKRAKATNDATTLRELESRIGFLSNVGKIDGDGEAMLSHCLLHGVDAVDSKGHKAAAGEQMTHSLNVAKWSAYADACKAELAKLTPQAAKLKEKVEGELLLCEGHRDHYVCQLG